MSDSHRSTRTQQYAGSAGYASFDGGRRFYAWRFI